MARKGLLERKVEGAISPTQKFEADASINIVKPCLLYTSDAADE